MKINKQAVSDYGKRTWVDYPRARDAFKDYLLSLNLKSNQRVLLPNYIGFSIREGSGVFDPIVQANVNFAFYDLDEYLNIDVESVQSCFAEGGNALIVIIHYFGYVDPNYKTVIDLARRYGIRILEDQAHSLFTDLIGGLTGRECDASIYSLHKMFPIETGGAMSIYGSDRQSTSTNVSSLCLNYDMKGMADIRISNAKYLSSRLSGFQDLFTLLRPVVFEGVVPQTFPILINSFDRDRLYDLLNSEGYGVVSLYHTMISQISTNSIFRTNLVSKKIMNLPVHHDITEDVLSVFCDRLISILSGDC